MKTITIKNTEIEEMIYAKDLPVVVRYKLLDDLGNVVTRKTVKIEKDDIPQAGKTVLTNLLSRLLAKVESDEGL